MVEGDKNWSDHQTARPKMLKAIKKTRIHEEVVSQIYQMIRDGRLKAGDQCAAKYGTNVNNCNGNPIVPGSGFVNWACSAPNPVCVSCNCGLAYKRVKCMWDTAANKCTYDTFTDANVSCQ